MTTIIQSNEHKPGGGRDHRRWLTAVGSWLITWVCWHSSVSYCRRLYQLVDCLSANLEYFLLPLASTNLLTASNRNKLTHIAHRASKTSNPPLYFILLPWLQIQINCLEIGTVQQELGPLSSPSIAFTTVVAAAFQAILSFSVLPILSDITLFSSVKAKNMNNNGLIRLMKIQCKTPLGTSERTFISSNMSLNMTPVKKTL